MSQLVLVIATVLGAVLCFPGTSTAQPAPPPPEAASPQAAPVASPAPSALPAPPAPPAPLPPPPPPSDAVPPSAVSFGPPSQFEPSRAARPVRDLEPEPEPVNGRRLDEGTAVALSLGGTLGAWATMGLGLVAQNGGIAVLGVLGTLVGPTMGHWYGGAILTRGMGLRVVGAAAMFYGVITLFCEFDCNDRGEYALIGGFLVYVGATIDDIVTAPFRVRERNRRFEIGLAPMVTDHSAGLALGGRF
jgi:hypothetical protein